MTFLCDKCTKETVGTWNGRCESCQTVAGPPDPILDPAILVRRIGGRSAAASALRISKRVVGSWFNKRNRGPEWCHLELLRYKCEEMNK